MSEINARFYHGFVVTEAPDMRKAYEEISKLSLKFAGIDWQSDVMYGDEPTRIVVGFRIGNDIEVFETVNLIDLVKNEQEVKLKFERIKDQLEMELAALELEFGEAETILFSYEY